MTVGVEHTFYNNEGSNKTTGKQNDRYDEDKKVQNKDRIKQDITGQNRPQVRLMYHDKQLLIARWMVGAGNK